MHSLRNLDLNLLKVFDAIQKERSVSIAADRLNMTQPSVSNALNRLRHTLGDQLFIRTRDGMEPTLFAQNIARSVQIGLKEIENSILEELAFEPENSSRSFTILATDMGEKTYIAALMSRLEVDAPKIKINVFEAPLSEYGSALEFGHADFAIGRLEFSDRLVREHIASCRFSVLICAQHAKRLGISEGATIPLDLYMQQKHLNVLTRTTAAPRHPVDLALQQKGVRRRIALTLPHASVLSGILPGTSLIATVPDAAVAEQHVRPGLVCAKLPFEPEVLRIHLIWHKRQQQDKGHIWMREQIRSLSMEPWNVKPND